MTHPCSQRTWSKQASAEFTSTTEKEGASICAPQIPNEILASSAMESHEILYEAVFSFEDHPKNPLH
jgi:hypothetical protein